MKSRKSEIEKYLRGELSPAEMHALEKEALNDPFLAEAMEGMEQAGPDNFLYDLHRINRSIHDRSLKRKRNQTRTLRMWGWTSGIAAAVLLVAVSGFLVISILREQAASQRAMKELAQVSDDGKERDTVLIPLPREVALTTIKSEPQEILIPAVRKPGEEPTTRIADRGPGREMKEQREEISPRKPDTEKRAALLQHEAEEKPELPAAGLERDARDLESANNSQEKSIIVKGRVVSAADGDALPGVNVMIKGTDTGTVTDPEGNYQLAVPPQGTLVFSFIGFGQQEVAVAGNADLDVALNEDIASLSEVVVTGYGATGKGSADAGPFSFAAPDGGRPHFKEYLNKAVRYPQQAIDNKVQGKVTVRFTVEPNGTLTGFEVIRGVGHGCDEELIRAIREGPAWKPSAHGDNPFRDQVKVRYRFELPK